MARLQKHQLLDYVEEAFRLDGWNVLFLSAPNEHPGRYRIYRDSQSLTVKVYIWNITHGGGNRDADEYRIQITGLNSDHFIPEVGGVTLILGWFANEQVFAGFDYRRHSGALGGSPSFQIGLSALRAAVVSRFAAYLKGNGELAIAFRPDFLGTYATNLEALHDTGGVPAEVELLTRIAEKPEENRDAEIAAEVAAPRQWAITQTRRALRALDFRERVFTAYGQQCAICGVQLDLLDGAHILPVADPDSTDETSNGIALCTLHHRAYDRSLVTFDADYRVHLNGERIDELSDANLAGGLREFQAMLRAIIHLPPNRDDRPRREFVEKANALRRWRL